LPEAGSARFTNGSESLFSYRFNIGSKVRYMTVTSPAPIAVLGATGAQGAPVVEASLSAGHPVRALGRTPAKLAPLAERGIDTRAIDLADTDGLAHALTGVSAVFAHLPFVPVPELIEAWSESLIRALAAAGVPMTVFTLSGPAPSSPTGIPAADTKALAKRILDRAETPLVGFEPGGYLGNLLLSAPSVVHEGELRYPLPADHRWAWISTEDQAALAVAATQRPDLAGTWFRIGEHYVGAQLAEGIGDALERPVRYVALDPDDFGRILAPMLGEQAATSVADDYRFLAERSPLLDPDADTTALRRALDVPATTIADWARTQPWAAAAAHATPIT
jgi:uncharacterized protein YbjT (DUF2867 family)